MTSISTDTMLQLRSLIKSSGELELSLARIPIPEPGPDEVLVRVQAAPMNPSDLGLLFGGADLASARASGTAAEPVITASVAPALMLAMASRVDQPLPVGNEGAGLVVRAGVSPAAQALIGKTVAVLGGAMYVQYRAVKAAQCLVLPPGTTPADGAACFVNPLTALGMVETMRGENHKALVHTVAASNLGQMLNRICIQDGVALVNIVRKPQQEELLRAQGATHVCNSGAATFKEDLTRALVATGATIAFDAIGGGALAGQILAGMEAAAIQNGATLGRYGTSVHKQVYIYGGLDRRPTELVRSFGMAWGMGGWLLFPFLEKIGAPAAQKLRERVLAELKTTFASHYARELSMADALQLDAIAQYSQHATGAKVLLNPNQGL